MVESVDFRSWDSTAREVDRILFDDRVSVSGEDLSAHLRKIHSIVVSTISFLRKIKDTSDSKEVEKAEKRFLQARLLILYSVARKIGRKGRGRGGGVLKNLLAWTQNAFSLSIPLDKRIEVLNNFRMVLEALITRIKMSETEKGEKGVGVKIQ